MKKYTTTTIQTILYCLSISWKSCKLYTLFRFIGKTLIPILSIVSSFILKYILDLLSATQSFGDSRYDLIIFVLLVTLISLLSSVVNKLIRYADSLHNDIIDRYITLDIMDKVLSADIEMFDNPKYYDKLTSVQRDSFATSYILWNALDCLSAAVAFLGAFGVLCSSDWLYGVLMIAAVLPSAIANQKYTKIIYDLNLSQVNEERQKNYLYNVASSKSYVQDVRLFDLGGMLRNRYTHLWSNIFSAKKRKIKGRTIWTTLLEFLPELVIAYAMLDITFRVLAGNATVGDYSLYTGLMKQLMSAIFLFTTSGAQVYENKLKIDNVKSFDQIPKHVMDTGTRELETVKTIGFSHVTFAYPSTNRNVLTDVSFFVNQREKVALVGINGSGKSTLIKLLLRFYEPDTGEILINGNSIKSYTLSSLRKCFSCYFQNAANFGLSLRENVSIADLERAVEDKEIITALQESGGDTIICRAPQGLDTYITRMFIENGMELSGGENQKVSLARTFYRRCSALVLDEPSSDLDPESEHRLFLSLEKLCKDKTTLFTSHRLSNITLADRIIVLENGSIIESGTWVELLKKDGRFAELYQYQAEKYLSSGEMIR